MVITWTVRYGWMDDKICLRTPQAGDMVSENSEREWEKWIPAGLKKEALRVPIEEVSFMIVNKKSKDSTYLHLKGFKGDPNE